MSKITNDGLTQSGTGCLVAVSIWQQWALEGLTYPRPKQEELLIVLIIVIIILNRCRLFTMRKKDQFKTMAIPISSWLTGLVSVISSFRAEPPMFWHILSLKESIWWQEMCYFDDSSKAGFQVFRGMAGILVERGRILTKSGNVGKSDITAKFSLTQPLWLLQHSGLTDQWGWRHRSSTGRATSPYSSSSRELTIQSGTRHTWHTSLHRTVQHTQRNTLVEFMFWLEKRLTL